MKIKLKEVQIEKISRIIGEIITGSELTQKLKSISVEDVSNESTKWRRIYKTFLFKTQNDNSSNSFLRFIKVVLQPEAFIDKEDVFEQTIDSINKILAFEGLKYNNKGEFEIVEKVETISEARKRVNSIVSKLKNMNVNPNVLNYCNEELLNENYFHAVFEAAKGLSDKVKSMTGLTGDGAALFEAVFSVDKPVLAINSLMTDAEKNQQKGLCMLLKGVFLMVRNVTAHTPKIKWIIDENEAIKMLMTISYIQDYLDNCILVPKCGG